MSATIELKCTMVEMITQLEDDASVEELYQIILEFLREKRSVTDHLTPGQLADVEQAHEESFDPAKWIPHEVVMKKYESLYGALDDSEPAEAWIDRIRSSRTFNPKT